MDKPKDPLTYLIQRLKNKKRKRFFLVGPPGSNVKQISLRLSQYFNSVMISVGDLLNKEIVKKTDLGQQIEEYIKNFVYVPDEIVV